MSPNHKPKASQDSKLVVLSAPSGTGKSTLASMLLSRHASFQLSISHTTRAPRGEEKQGVHYFFVSEKEFQGMIEAEEFLEHAQVFGKHRYGTSRESVEKWLKAGKHVLFDIDIQGARSLKEAYKERCVTIFILPPSLGELESRLRNRKTESPDAIESRLRTAETELKAAPEFDYRITNRDLEESYRELEEILKKESCI
ncbi:MAG: guanylate kinase [Bdellovibrionota bacterium]